jgi:hypothetical protein
VPPLVAQHLTWLKPTAANKMYNAELAERRSPGIAVEPRRWPSDPGRIGVNTKAFLPILDAATTPTRLFGQISAADGFGASAKWNYDAWVGRVSHSVLLSVLQSIKLEPEDALLPDVRWLSSLTPHQIDGWTVVFPQQVRSETRRRVLGHEPISVFSRIRLRSDYYSALSELAHRWPIELIKRGRVDIGDESARQFVRSHSGTILVYPTVDRIEGRDDSVPGHTNEELEPAQVTMAFHLVAPLSAIGRDSRLVLFTTRVTSRRNEAIVDKV